MKPLKPTDLTDGEIEAVFRAAAAEAVGRAKATGRIVPSMAMQNADLPGNSSSGHGDRSTVLKPRRSRLASV